MKNITILILLFFIASSCDGSKISKTPDSQFIGKWVLSGRGMFDGIEIEIKKQSEGVYFGEVTKLNDNKYVMMFMENGDKFISSIKRKSNFEFTINEIKIAAPLFSAYGQSTTAEFKATFDGKDKIMLGNNGSSGFYTRIK